MRCRCRMADSGTDRLRKGALWGAMMALPVLTLVVGLRVWAADPVGVTVAAEQLRAALATMDATFNEMPTQARETLAVDVKLLGQSIDRTLLRIEQAPVPPIDESLVHDLDFLTDLLIAMTGEMRALEGTGGGDMDAVVTRRIEGMSAVAAARFDELDRVTDAWIERTRRDIVELKNDDGTIVLNAVDRTVQATVRHAGVVLLLVGLLLVGLQLLRLGQEHARAADHSWAPPRRPLGALGALTLFFVGALVLAIFPSSLSWLAASEEIHPQEHPCERLAAQRVRLELTGDVDHEGLIEARKHRMVSAAQDCLGLPSEQAAVAAVDRLVERSGVVAARAPLEDPPMASTQAAVTAPASAATTGVGGPDMEAATPTETASEATSTSDVLAELLAALRRPVAPSIDTESGIEPAAPPQEVTTTVEPEPPVGLAAVATEAAGAPETGETGETGTYTVTTGLNYRVRPSTDAPRLGFFEPGAQVRVTGFEDGWAEVELSDGRRVFAFGEFLERVP